ncbi:MAG: NUDIX hydrolase [Rubricoccaceae bacterium]
MIVLPPHEALADRLARRLAVPLPGHTAHAQMAPFPNRTDASVISVEHNAGRPAATLVLLFPGAAGAGTSLVLTLRQPTLRAHSGQVALPGGRLDPGETPEDAARREAWEEVGVAPGAPRVLGRLTPLYIPPSGYSVWPVVATVAARPAFRVQADEVAALIEVPLAELLAPEARRSGPRRLAAGAPAEVPFFALGGHEVWGATAMMLAEFCAVVTEACRTPGGVASR